MFNKVKKSALALGCAALPFLTQVTMSGGSVALETDEVSSLGTAIANGATSLVNMAITILPIALGFTVVMIIYRIICDWAALKNGLMSRKEHRAYRKFWGKKNTTNYNTYVRHNS